MAIGGPGARPQHAEVELEADEEHVEDDAELRDDAQKRRGIGRQDEGGRVRSDAAQQRRPEQDAADDFADHRRLIEALERAFPPAAP